MSLSYPKQKTFKVVQDCLMTYFNLVSYTLCSFSNLFLTDPFCNNSLFVFSNYFLAESAILFVRFPN